MSYVAVHGAMYLSRAWHPTRQPADQRDRWVQAGEVIALWQAENEGHWYRWHIDNPHVVRVAFPGAQLEELNWLVAEYTMPDDDNVNRVVAARLWRLDTASIGVKEEARLGRPLNRTTDILTFDAAWRKANLAREAGAPLANKAAGDVKLENPGRVAHRGGEL